MAIALIDSTKENACRTAEADAIRRKTGGSAAINYDFTNDKGFADAIAAIPTGGITPTGNIELTQQSGTDVTNYATASVRSGSVSLNTPSVNASGLVTASVALATSGWVGSAPSSKTLQLSTQGATTITPTESTQTAVASGKYTTGAVTVAAVPTETKTATANGDVTPTSGKFLSKVSVAIPVYDGSVS